MASWNDLTEGGQLTQCPVCLCFLAKKKKVTHILECYDNKKGQMDELGVIQCPLSRQHVLPLIYLDHHLDGNCQEAMNLLRKFFQKQSEDGISLEEYRGAPPDWRPENIPIDRLSQRSLDLLYLLDRYMYGGFKEDFERRERESQANSENQDNEENSDSQATTIGQ